MSHADCMRDLRGAIPFIIREEIASSLRSPCRLNACGAFGSQRQIITARPSRNTNDLSLCVPLCPSC